MDRPFSHKVLPSDTPISLAPLSSTDKASETAWLHAPDLDWTLSEQADWPDAFWQQSHVPVMLQEVLRAAAPLEGAALVDGTFGAGGYSQAFLQAGAAQVLGIDQDLKAAEVAQKRFGTEPRFSLLHGNFGDLESLIASSAAQAFLSAESETDLKLDALVLDLGVSSMQIDQASRGFSFKHKGPLDMRMNQSQGQTAADLVNTVDEAELARILFLYGEEKRSRAIARAICQRRLEKPFSTTDDLADLIRAVLGPPKRHKSAQGRTKTTDPATRSFQALRIAVNNELGQIEAVLQASLAVLKPGGRLVVVTFHSLEDRIVKQFLAETGDQKPAPSRHLPFETPDAPLFRLNPRKAIKPSETEIAKNPRARSAKLRIALRTATPAGLEQAGAKVKTNQKRRP